MNKQGFTLIEVLTVVLIIGTLTAVALPKYVRAIERSRATEAMAIVKAINDATYAYFEEKQELNCATLTFSKLAVSMPKGTACPGGTAAKTVVCTKNFKFELNNANTAEIPGTDGCKGVLATRIHGGDYSYKIWNPYDTRVGGKAFSLRCAGDDQKNKDMCDSLGLLEDSEEEE